MELIVELGVGGLVIALLVITLGVWRISRVVSWRSLAMIARATGSFEECVAFIRFCAQQDTDMRDTRHFAQRRGIAPSWGPAQSLDEIPHASP